MPTINIQSHLDPNASWKFEKVPGCKHANTKKAKLGTYIDGQDSGTIHGLQCKDCKALKYV